jgi:hypothetical protein
MYGLITVIHVATNRTSLRYRKAMSCDRFGRIVGRKPAVAVTLITAVSSFSAISSSHLL